MKDLFVNQVNQLKEYHFLILFWVATAESKKAKYNITYVYDDLKYLGITRTKQNVVAYIEALATLCFINLNDESNRKNLYITRYGAKALELLVKQRAFTAKPSKFLEGIK